MIPEENKIGWKYSLKILTNPKNLIESLKKFDINDVSEY